MRWTNPIRLKDFEKAPKEAGLFQIGQLRVTMFDPKYIGRALGAHSAGDERTIRSRLADLYEGRGASQITATSRDNLFCRWMVTDDLEGAADTLLKRHGIGMLAQFVWNNKRDGVD